MIHVLNGIGFSGAALKQQFNELINGKSQTNRNQISNLLFLQQLKPDWFKPTKTDKKNRTKILIFTTLDTSQLKILVIVKKFAV